MEGTYRYAPAANVLRDCFLPMFLGKQDSNLVDDYMEMDRVILQIPCLHVTAGKKSVGNTSQLWLCCSEGMDIEWTKILE